VHNTPQSRAAAGARLTRRIRVLTRPAHVVTIVPAPWPWGVQLEKGAPLSRIPNRRRRGTHVAGKPDHSVMAAASAASGDEQAG